MTTPDADWRVRADSESELGARHRALLDALARRLDEAEKAFLAKG
jgi:hypothetical protein